MKAIILLSACLFTLSSCSTQPLPLSTSINTLKKVGHYGHVQYWNENNRTPHKIPVSVPQHASVIISDYHSRVGANGYPRGGIHRGVDIYHETGTPIIAAADGVVIKKRIGNCWGPTLLLSHGRMEDGRPLYTLYGHMRNMRVNIGDKVKRGEQIAEMGVDVFNSCVGGLHHLHFQVSHNARGIPIGWGWSYFVGDGGNAPNPHKYWADGPGKITCFEPGKTYRKDGLTYPLLCDGDATEIREHKHDVLSEQLELLQTVWGEFLEEDSVEKAEAMWHMGRTRF